MTRTNILRNGPIIGFLCVLFLMWPAKIVLQQIEHARQARFDLPLAGQFSRPAKPQNTLSGLWDHDYQKWAEAAVADQIPLNANIIRSVNQFYFSLFDKSYMGGDNPLIIGKGKNIFTQSYLVQYCGTNRNAPAPAEFAAWAARLDKLRMWFESQGKTFIYFASPSKASYYAGDIPDGFGCATGEHQARFKRAMAALAKTGVRTVDAATLILNEKGKHGIDLFPTGGIHYNSVGAALTVNALTGAIGASRATQIPPISTRYQRKTADGLPRGSIDRDITDLLNLVRPNLGYAVPELAWGGYPYPTPLPLKVTFVGGSFVAQPARLMALYKLFQSVDQFSYFRLAKVVYPDESASKPSSAADYDSLFASDVIILEENEETAMSSHGIAFIEEAERRQKLQ